MTKIILNYLVKRRGLNLESRISNYVFIKITFIKNRKPDFNLL